MLKRLPRRIYWLILAFCTAGGVWAYEVLDGELCTIEADQTIEEDIFVFCGELRIDGHVKGHLIGAARTATITGQIDGSIYLLGGELIMGGTLGKDIHFGGLAMQVTDEAEFEHKDGGIISGNLSATIDREATIPGSILDAGYQLIVNGDVDQQINFWGSALHLNGRVSGNVRATVGSSQTGGVASQISTLLIPLPIEVELVDPGLVVGKTAQIEGQLTYTGPTKGRLEGEFAQTPIFIQTEPAIVGTPVEPTPVELRNYLQNVLQEFALLSLIGMVLMFISPRWMQAPLQPLRLRPISTLGIGILTFILSFPIFLIIAVFSIAIVVVVSLLPLDSVAVFSGVALVLANVGGASVFYFMAIYIARIIFGLGIGKFVVSLLFNFRDGWRSRYLSLIIGLFVFAIFNSIPIYGWGVNALALFMGLGAILTIMRRQLKQIIDPNVMRIPNSHLPLLPAPTFVEQIEDTVYVPPITNPEPPAPGTLNLPEGFNWWQDDDV